jgi:hypothetical protein
MPPWGAPMLKLRRGVVTSAEAPTAWQRLTVEVAGEERAACADTSLVGPAEVGDDVIVNTEAVDLHLGSGGADLVHVNLTRGLDGKGTPGAHVMKLNYSSLQHAVLPVEARDLATPLNGPVAVFQLHGQLAPLAWALAQARPHAKVGYVQTAGGALPGAMSDTVRQLLDRGLLAGHTTAAPAYGGRQEAITTAGALHDGLAAEGWDVALAGPGPGILGSASALGHGGMTALDTAHAALALGCPTVLTARMSSGDPRERHRGLSHHTRTVLDLLLKSVTLPVPQGIALFREMDGIGPALEAARAAGHEIAEASVDVEGYRASGLPTRTMGRTLDEDRLFFSAALAAGGVLGGMA